MAGGFVDRAKGKMFLNSASVQQFGKGTAASAGGGQIYTQQYSTGLALANVQTESTMLKYVLPPNSLDIMGRSLLITAFGNFPSTNNAIHSGKLYFGAASISIGQSTTSSAAQAFMLQWTVQKSGPSQQVLMSQVIVSSVHGGLTVSTATEVDTLGSTIKFTGTSTAASAAGDVVLYNLQVQALN